MTAEMDVSEFNSSNDSNVTTVANPYADFTAIFRMYQVTTYVVLALGIPGNVSESLATSY